MKYIVLVIAVFIVAAFSIAKIQGCKRKRKIKKERYNYKYPKK